MRMLNQIHNEIASFNLFQMGLFWVGNKKNWHCSVGAIAIYWMECIPMYMYICYLFDVFAKAFMFDPEKNENRRNQIGKKRELL